MLEWSAVVGAAVGALGFLSIRDGQMPRTAVGAGVSDVGILVSGAAGQVVGSVGRWTATAAEKAILVTGASLATGVGDVIDAVAAPAASVLPRSKSPAAEVRGHAA